MDVFGSARAAATGALAASSIGFAGQYLESATGLYDMRARDYDPASGRFTANDPVVVPTGMPYFSGYSYAYNNPLVHSDASGNWSSNCGVFSQLCDSASFFGNEIVGAVKGVVGVAAAVVNPVATYNGWVDSCNAGFAQYGGNGPSFEGFLQCVDNLNPIAAIRNQFGASLTATNVQESGQAFGQGLLGTAFTATPFVEGIVRPPANCGTVGRGTTAASAGATPSALSVSPKIAAQMGPRGWSQVLIDETIKRPEATHLVWDFTTGTKQTATAYARSDGAYVVMNDSTGSVVQVSDIGNTGWKPVWNDPRFQR